MRAGWVLMREGVITALPEEGAPPPMVFAKSIAKVVRRRRAVGAPQSKILGNALNRLGPSWVKLGQFLATRPDIVGDSIAYDLELLQDRMEPFPTEDARAMVKTAEMAGKALMVHENFRWQSAVRTVIDTVRAGTIGTPFFCRAAFRSGYDVFSGQPYLAEGERFIIEDLGIHVLDIVRAVMGDVARVSAHTNRINPDIKGEDVATILLSHDSGMASVVDCSYATRRTPETFPETLLEVDGDAGSLYLKVGYQLEIHSGGSVDVRDVSPPVLDWAERPWHNIQESVAIIQQHFVDCLNTGAVPETSGADNLKTLTLVEAAYRSAAQGKTMLTNEL